MLIIAWRLDEKVFLVPQDEKHKAMGSNPDPLSPLPLLSSCFPFPKGKHQVSLDTFKAKFVSVLLHLWENICLENKCSFPIFSFLPYSLFYFIFFTGT